MNDYSPGIIEEETSHLFLCYCTFLNTLKGRKMSIQNVFVSTLEEEKLKRILKTILTLDTDQELVKVFLNYDPTLAKSKFVTGFINARNSPKKKKKK